MKTLIVIDSNRNAYQEIRNSLLFKVVSEEGCTCEIIDMNDPNTLLYEKFYQIEKTNPDWLLTIDYAGFECRNGMGDVSLNRMPCRMAHLVFSNDADKIITKEEIFNYSMYFFAPREECVTHLRENLSVQHVYIMPELSNLLVSDNSEEIITSLLQQLWDIMEMSIDFKECRLQ